jgi:hypothetical protein
MRRFSHYEKGEATAACCLCRLLFTIVARRRSYRTSRQLNCIQMQNGDPKLISRLSIRRIPQNSAPSLVPRLASLPMSAAPRNEAGENWKPQRNK